MCGVGRAREKSCCELLAWLNKKSRVFVVCFAFCEKGYNCLSGLSLSLFVFVMFEFFFTFQCRSVGWWTAVVVVLTDENPVRERRVVVKFFLFGQQYKQE